MDFKDLMQKMYNIDEGIEDQVDECGEEMPTAVIQGPGPTDDSLNMNVTINSKGPDGIRELMNVLKGIGGNEPKDMPGDDDDKLFGIEKGHGKSVVIGDDFENSVEGDEGEHVYDLEAVLTKGNDFANKNREARKVNGGGNPQVQESLITHLSSLYEEVKDRSQKKR